MLRDELKNEIDKYGLQDPQKFLDVLRVLKKYSMISELWQNSLETRATRNYTTKDVNLVDNSEILAQW
jgi:hypothetical protein